MPKVQHFVPILIACFVALAAFVGFAPPNEDFVSFELKKDCRTLRERTRANPASVVAVDMDAACKRVGF